MTHTWWKEAVIYQIYPRSFKDGNGDGIGDLRGITQKLDYLEELGIDVLWLSPVYESPNDDNGYDIMTVGEAPGVPPRWANLYVGESRSELNMIFHFGHMMLDWGPVGKFDPKNWSLNEFKDVFNTWHKAVGQEGWISIFLDNHDFPRLVSRWGNDGQYRVESAKLLATLLLTMRGTLSIYQGTEIGMTNVAYESFEDYRDLETINEYQEAKARGDDTDAFLKVVHQVGRDNVRTPMQWNDSPNAGFTTAAEPWIKVNPNPP